MIERYLLQWQLRRQRCERHQLRNQRSKNQRFHLFQATTFFQIALCFTLACAFHPLVIKVRRPGRMIRIESRLFAGPIANAPSIRQDSDATSTQSILPNIPNRTRDVRFISPLLEYGYKSVVEEYENGTLANKPLLLYLPGFDGTFFSPFLQFPELSTIFDVRCMTIGTDDRSSFAELSDQVIQYLQSELLDAAHSANETSHEHNNTSSSSSSYSLLLNFLGVGRKEGAPKQKRSVYLAGESFGGILALNVASRLVSKESDNGNDSNPSVTLQGLSLINPATCFDRSRLAAQGPAVADLPPWLYAFGLLRLLPLFADEYSLPQLGLILSAKALPSVIDTAEREAYMGRVALSLPFVLPFMKQETLKWRLSEWLAEGCDQIANQLANVAPRLDIPVLIVAGERDGTLPSIAEAERLAGILPDVSVHVVEGAGHASTCGSRVDLAALFRNRFTELSARESAWSRSIASVRRTAMKEAASAGIGAYFGMESRYDNATIGLSPLLYWNKRYWKNANQTHLLR
ncbi:hypothetical protein MPSEU_000935500 [Mayamaea pseudoterrestris]|nr:hypothetical protein MPSEU_000935500 [Mayamaea pseudoterrestris]